MLANYEKGTDMLDTIQGRIAARISDICTLIVLFFILWMISSNREEKKVCLFKGIASTALGMAFIVIIEKIMKSYPAYLVCFLIIGIVYSKWALNLSLQNTLLVSIFYIAAQFSLAFVEEWVGIHSFRFLAGGYRSIFTQLVILLFFVIFRRLFQETFSRQQRIPMSYYTLVVTVFVCSLIVKNRFMGQGTHSYLPDDMRYLGTIAILLFAVNLLIFYVYSRITADRMRWQETYTLQLRHELEKKVMEEIALSNQILSQKQHDFKQHIATLAFLADGEEYKELKQYCHSLLNQSFEGRIQTGNPVVNAIVNQKGIQARKQGVDFTVESDKLPVSLPIENIDLSVLIGNLLDNAVEACCELKDAKITLKIKIFPGYLAIRVTNPVKENIQRTNPHLHSSKKNKETHGWGLPSIRMIAEKYSGKLCIEMKEKSFEATAMLFWKK